MSSYAIADLTIRRATAEDLDAIAMLKSVAWGGVDTTPWRRRWAWQFTGHPQRDSDEPTFLVAESNSTLVGGIGWIPMRLAVGGAIRAGVFPCDIFVHPSAHRGGTGRALVAEIERRAEVVVWMGASPKMLGVFAKLGYPRVDPVRFMGLVLDPGAFHREGLSGAFGTVLSLAVYPIAAATRVLADRHPIPSGVDLLEEADFGPAWDRFLARRHGFRAIRPVRDRAYMHWRYLAEPSGCYRFAVARERVEVRGFVAYRVREGIPRVGVLADVMADPERPRLVTALVGNVIRRLREERVAAVKVLATSAASRRVLLSAGFLPSRSTPHVFLTPEPARAAGITLQGRRWELSLGDGDLEFG